MQRWYSTANAYFFDGALPKIKIVFADLPGTVLARTHYHREAGTKKKFIPHTITIDPILKTPCLGKELGRVLLHEMVHVKLGARVSCEVDHGVFEKEMHRLVNVGAFNRLW